ncbi:unnamed protein product [Ilex paraguariensis]|uniref:CRAL-TRIO domain-containing protein n=1 Tax=Ilex paraguariensis TaxID=185542 RepID=A0ABC8R3U5_9AQUA
MGKKDQIHLNEKDKERVQAVLDLLKNQVPLTPKQEKFCSNACVERFLKARGNSVKKTAKQLQACLQWRESIGTEHLIADEFSAELAEGVAYVSGHDDESRPVMDEARVPEIPFPKTVAIQTMPKNVEQFVLLFDASYFRSASAFMNVLLAILKIISEYYPGRLRKAFIIDPPSLFSYLWKGVGAFVELSPLTMVVSSFDYEESLYFNDSTTYRRASSLRFDPSSVPSTAKVGSSSSSRFSFTVSHHHDSLKPWYLNLTDTSASKVGPITPSSSILGPALISPVNARSLSFASPIARRPCGNIKTAKKGFFPSTPLPQKTQKLDPSTINYPRTPRPSFLQSPASFFRKECHIIRVDKCRESFVPFLRFYRRPYDEMTYRSKMKPPLGGLISIVSPHVKSCGHMSASQRF